MTTEHNYWLSLSENPQFLGKFTLLEAQLDNGCSLEQAIANANLSQQDLEQFLMVIQAGLGSARNSKNPFKQKLAEQQQAVISTVTQGLRQFIQQQY